MKQHEAYEKDMDIKLKKWGAKIDEMKANMDRADAKTRESYYGEIERLRALQHKAREKLESMRHAGKESLLDIKAGVEKAVKDLEDAAGSALSRFK
jgi:hypothetical protein